MDVSKIAPQYMAPYMKDAMKSDFKEAGKLFVVTGAAAGAVALAHSNKTVNQAVGTAIKKVGEFVSKPKFMQNFVSSAKDSLKKVLSPDVVAKLKNMGPAGKLAAVLAPVVAMAGFVTIAKSYYNTGKITQQYIDKSNAQ